MLVKFNVHFFLFQSNQKNPRLGEICKNGTVNSQSADYLGGGGGGGATYVFKVLSIKIRDYKF